MVKRFMRYDLEERKLKRQAYNPYLPHNVYIPDGEPHVFADRVYVFGSHDKEGGSTYCSGPYEVWSALVNDRLFYY